MSPRYLLAVVAALTATTCGCATLDARAVAETHRLDRAPYYVDLARALPAPGACAVVLPVTVDPELRRQFGYEDRGAELQRIADALNARAARRDGCVRASTAAPAAPKPPRVWVGTSDSEYAPFEASAQRVDADRFAPMVLHFERPCDDWKREAGALATAADVPYTIAIQVGVSHYAKGYAGAFRKEVVLGTGHREPIRFLTAEDKPVEVLHLTGVLLDAGGRPVRAGAEGVVLRDTPFLAQAVNASRTLDAITLERVLQDERRTDLPGAPLKLDVAFDNLVAQLTRASPTVPAR
jgi:hypothetical protein